MGNPNCPFCGLPLERRTVNYPGGGMLNRSRKKIWSCRSCDVHWPISAVVSKNTASPGDRPPKLESRFVR